MPAFAYTARDDQGRTHRGTREAPTEMEIAAALRRDGLLPLRIVTRDPTPGRLRPPSQWFGPRPIDVEMELRQLGFMLRTGLSLLQALRICGEQASRGSTRVWRRVADDIRSGASLHESMARHRCFPRLACSLVDVGERSGNLDTVLTRSATAMGRRRQTKTQVLTALAYPALVVTLAIGTVAFLMLTVIPKLARFVGSLGRQLPPSTQLLIDLSEGVQRHFLPVTIGLLVALGLLALAWTTARGRAAIETVLLRVPLLGRILRLASVSTFAHNTSLLLASGVRLTAALAIVQPLFFCHSIAARVGRARERVVQGVSLSEALTRERSFSPLLHGMVAVGEASGSLDEVLEGVAQHHDDVLRELVRRLGTIVEPMILIVVGSIVGFIYFAFFMAIYSVSGVGSS